MTHKCNSERKEWVSPGRQRGQGSRGSSDEEERIAKQPHKKERSSQSESTLWLDLIPLNVLVRSTHTHRLESYHVEHRRCRSRKAQSFVRIKSRDPSWQKAHPSDWETIKAFTEIMISWSMYAGKATNRFQKQSSELRHMSRELIIRTEHWSRLSSMSTNVLNIGIEKGDTNR